MRGKSNQNQEEEDYEEDESRKDGPSSNNANNNTNKDGKNIDKASAIRSKHSVTEQRRRSKINERYQILRDLIPHSDQKRDTASFLLEVIEYVQYLQEKVQKYEGSYQGWSPEPTKLMPWRNSHWRVQGFTGQPHAVKNGSGPGSTFGGKFDENNISVSPTMLTSTENLVEFDTSRDAACKAMEQSDVASKGMPSVPFQTNMTGPVCSDGVMTHPHQQQVSGVQTAEFPVSSNTPNPQEELTIEGGTISISSVYSEGLLNNLTEALQSAGVDLSQANISVQIDLGKRAHRGLMTDTSTAKEPQNPPSNNQAVTRTRDANSAEELDQVKKRLKS